VFRPRSRISGSVQHEAAFAISADPVASLSSLPERRGRRAWQCPHSAEGDMRALNEGVRA
jgi:hypothetical protein